ncbi:MAG: glutamine-hydrolyzing carbamoyl-phosphate synthase small subunit [Endozoicomonadaceae bacterium]|nr:glutamine-hydrolyzing carbamoyl-phosphate synthase small subunit [Endozoicomonadaceae bacterium]
MSRPAILALGDGNIFKGVAIGADGETSGEVVFNTAMTGYQEIITDPSYARQIVTLTYPHIGNTGTTPEDAESDQIWAAGLVIRDLPLLASNWRNQQSLDDYLKQRNIVAIANIDTRRLTRVLREKGVQNGCIIANESPDQQKGLELARHFLGLKGMDLAKEVTTNTAYPWTQSVWELSSDSHPEQLRTDYHVVVYDFGVKRNILRMLAARGCRLTVVPAQTPATDVLAMNPNGVFLSNGPGDPEPCYYAIDAIREILNTDLPIFGICLGHQLLALASGAQTEKMKFGHHGANHPVQDITTGIVMITSQNHGFAVSESGLPEHLKLTHKSLFDGSLQGLERRDRPAFSFQGHPEAGPGPHDVASLFNRFVSMMAERR